MNDLDFNSEDAEHQRFHEFYESACTPTCPWYRKKTIPSAAFYIACALVLAAILLGLYASYAILSVLTRTPL